MHMVHDNKPSCMSEGTVVVLSVSVCVCYHASCLFQILQIRLLSLVSKPFEGGGGRKACMRMRYGFHIINAVSTVPVPALQFKRYSAGKSI